MHGRQGTHRLVLVRPSFSFGPPPRRLSSGYGYQPLILDDIESIDQDLAAAMEWALSEITLIQKAARSGKPIVKPRWPMIILRTPKGWTGPTELHGEYIEGSFRSHQVPLPECKSDGSQLAFLQSWLASYRPEELFCTAPNKDVLDGAPLKDLLDIVPEDRNKRLGMRKEAYAAYKPLKIADWKKFCVSTSSQASCMITIAQLLKQVIIESVSLSFAQICVLTEAIAAILTRSESSPPMNSSRTSWVLFWRSPDATCSGMLHIADNAVGSSKFSPNTPVRECYRATR